MTYSLRQLSEPGNEHGSGSGNLHGRASLSGGGGTSGLQGQEGAPEVAARSPRVFAGGAGRKGALQSATALPHLVLGRGGRAGARHEPADSSAVRSRQAKAAQLGTKQPHLEVCGDRRT